MKRFALIFSNIIITVALVAVTSNVQAQSEEEEEKNENTYLRAGLSDMTGFVGVEYFLDNTSIAIGWHQFAPSITNETYGCVDLSLYWYGIENYKQDGWYTALGYSTTNAVQTVNGDAVKTSGTVNFVGGYRWGGENFDVKLGAGYLYSKIYDGIAIDLSVGFSF